LGTQIPHFHIAVAASGWLPAPRRQQGTERETLRCVAAVADSFGYEVELNGSGS